MSKRIFIVYQRIWGIKFGQFLINQIQQNYPHYEIGVLTVKDQADLFFTQHNKVEDFAWYQYFDPVRDFSYEYLGEDDYEVAHICKDLAIDAPWELIYATRNHVKDYRKTFNYAFSPALGDDELMTSFKAYYKLIMDIEANFKPDLVIIPNPVEGFNIMLEYYARSRNIPCRQVAPTSVKGFYQYVQNKNQGGSQIHDLIKDPATNYDICRDKAVEYIREFRENFIVPECAYHDSSKFLSYEVTGMTKAFAKSVRALLFGKRLPKGLHADHGDWHPWLTIRDYFLKIHYYNAVKRFKYDDFKPVKKFVFFPLQMQPELAIDVLAPYHSNQIEMARLIAMSLPEDYTLVIKDHPIMVGRRRPAYLKKIQNLPNVKLINYSIKTPEILNRAACVIVTCGSIVFEAALTGKPVVQLGNLESSFLLPNVTHITDMTKLNTIWPTLLNKSLNGPDYEESLIKYVSINMQYGIETNYFEMWEQGVEGDLFPLWNCLKASLESTAVFS